MFLRLDPGFLFRSVTRSGKVAAEALSSAAVQARLNEYLSLDSAFANRRITFTWVSKWGSGFFGFI